MASALNDRYELIETIPAVVGDFVLSAYKVRETLPLDPDTPAGRVVMLRQIDSAANVPNVAATAQRGRDMGKHPNILVSYGLVEITGDGPIPAGLYVESEYARGISLRERIRRVAPFSLAITLEIAIAIGQAIQFAAQKGVNHGHLCAEQVLLTPEGQVRVADFGLSAAIHEALGDKTNALPEDIRALGAVINEMLTATLPALLPPDGLSPRALNPTVPPALDGIVRKATNTNPAIAYTSMTNLLIDLQAAREDLRNNRPLNWSPLGAPATPHRPPTKSSPGLLTQAATELANEGKKPLKPPAQAPAQPEYYDDPEPSGSPLVTKLLTALIIIVIVGGIGLVSYFATVLTIPSDVNVPTLVGKSFTDAQQLSKAGHFALTESDHSYNDTWPLGVIYQQDPLPGRSIKAGKNVNVSVSDGPPLTKVPELTQMTLARAKATLDSAGLAAGTVTEVYDDVNPKGIVVGQDPATDSMIPHKQLVNITVSKGPSPPATPDGLSASATLQGEIDLSWNPVSNASTYSVYRDNTKLATGLSDPSYSDMRMGDGETHQYSVTAVNGNGESAQSTPVTGTTLLPGGTAPTATAPPPVASPPPSTPLPAAAPAQSGPRQRQFHLRFRVPHHGDQHRVQVTLQDVTGTNTVYDEMQSPGAIVESDIQGFGNKVVIRIYIDGRLEKQETM